AGKAPAGVAPAGVPAWPSCAPATPATVSTTNSAATSTGRSAAGNAFRSAVARVVARVVSTAFGGAALDVGRASGPGAKRVCPGDWRMGQCTDQHGTKAPSPAPASVLTGPEH